jgi:hypothetical protein
MNEIENGSREILSAITDMSKTADATREKVETLQAKVESFKTDNQGES